MYGTSGGGLEGIGGGERAYSQGGAGKVGLGGFGEWREGCRLVVYGITMTLNLRSSILHSRCSSITLVSLMALHLRSNETRLVF